MAKLAGSVTSCLPKLVPVPKARKGILLPSLSVKVDWDIFTGDKLRKMDYGFIRFGVIKTRDEIVSTTSSRHAYVWMSRPEVADVESSRLRLLTTRAELTRTRG